MNRIMSKPKAKDCPYCQRVVDLMLENRRVARNLRKVVRDMRETLEYYASCGFERAYKCLNRHKTNDRK